MGSGRHVFGMMNDYLKRNGNGFSSFHVKLMQNITNILLLQKKKDFASSILFDLNTQTIFNVAIFCHSKLLCQKSFRILQVW
jgi:hypothetical protein